MQFTPSNMAFPYSAVVAVRVTFGDMWYIASGVIVGRNDVLTATHVIYDVNHGLADRVEVAANYHPQHNPNPQWYTPSHARYFPEVLGQWGQNLSPDGLPGSMAGSELDIALLSFRDALGDMYGSMGIAYGFDAGAVTMAGYPHGQHMIASVGNITHDSVDNVLHTASLGASPGHSGGPVFITQNGGPMVVGVNATLTYGTGVKGHEYWLRDALRDNDDIIDPRYGASFHGSDGDDVFTDTANGGTYFGYHGTDTVVISHARSRFDVEIREDSLIRLEGPSDIRLINIERAQFNDGALLFHIESANAPAAYRLYGGAFDRTPDEEGFLYWTNVLDSGTSLQQIASAFLASPEFIALYGADLGDAAFVDQLYFNVLDRAGDSGGIAYWNGHLASGGGRDDVLVAFTQLPEYVGASLPDIENGFWVV